MSAGDSDIKLKFKPDSLEEWRKWTVECLSFSKELLRAVHCEDMNVSETVYQELNKICVNAFIFRNFLDELIEVVELNENGELELLEEEIANIWKCLLALSESKKLLKDASLSLEVH